jgi:hypothetical protein
LFAQHRSKSRVEFSVSGAYLFGGILPTSNGDLNFVNKFGIAADINFKVTQVSGVELTYSYIPTELRFRDNFNNGNETKLFNLDMHYFFLNYVAEKRQGKVVPYGLVGFGAAIADPKDAGYNSEFRFATDIGGGVKLYPWSKVGFKIQARILIPIYSSSQGYYAGSSSSGYAVGTTGLIQADVSAGLTFKF